MDADPQVLLILIAMQLSGKRPIPATDEPFKTLKKPVQAAKDDGLLVERDTVALDKKGKPAKKPTKVLELTDKGKAILQAGAGPDMQANIAARQKAAILHALETDRTALRNEVVAALSAKSKTSDPAKAIGELDKAVKQLSQKLDKLEAALQSRADDAVLSRIDAAFATLQQQLAGAMAASAPSGQGATPAAGSESLASVLRRCYRTLRQFAEFNDGLVPIPRLYHEARRSLPHLSVEALHRELQSLWDRRQLELKVLNEVRMATEPDKGITRGENLYYYIFWNNA